MGGRPIHIRHVVRAAHLILTGYGHWLPNDIRGCGSTELRKFELDALGPIHSGRKRVQPPRDALREFHRAAKPMLTREIVWFDEVIRGVVVSAIAVAAAREG